MTFGRRLEAHLRAGFGAPTAEGPSRFHGAGLQAPGGRQGSEGVARPRCIQLAWPCLRSGGTWQCQGPCRTGCRRAHRHRNDRKAKAAHKHNPQPIPRLFLDQKACWESRGVHSSSPKHAVVPSPMLRASNVRRSGPHSQPSKTGTDHSVSEKEVSRAFSHPGGRRARPHGSMWREKKHAEEDSKIFLI